MAYLGKIFKIFRESRGMKLTEIAKPGLSKSQLSRFENGETDLTISKFMMALDAINIPIDEFMYAANDFKQNEFNTLLDKIRLYVTNKNIVGLKKLLIEQQEKYYSKKHFYKLNIILIKIKLQDLSGENYFSEQDINYLTDYLFSVENWGNYELLLFANSLNTLKHKTFMVLSKEMIKRASFYKEIPNNRRIISTMLLNSYITCIERNEFIDALYFEKQLKDCFFIETELYERLVFHYAKQLYQFKKNKNNLSIIEMRKCIAFMKLADSYQLAETFENYLEKILKSTEL